jgi:hypothetical protein
MLIYITPKTRNARVLDGQAQIVIQLEADGRTSLEAYANDRFDSGSRYMTDDRLLQRELPAVLAELRALIQKSSGSAVTE